MGRISAKIVQVNLPKIIVILFFYFPNRINKLRGHAEVVLVSRRPFIGHLMSKYK